MFEQINQNLNLIEPTLSSLAGHEYGYVASLIQANKNFGFNIHVWLSKAVDTKQVLSKLIHLNKCSVKIIKYFIRPIRQLQKIFLYYKFLKNKQTFYVCTAGLIDLVICDYLNKLFKFNNFADVAFFHFHQFNKNSSKINTLKKISSFSKNNFKILTTTNNLTKIFLDCGFVKCKTIACPSFAPKILIDKIQYNFNKILYAGVARKDKGFPLVVDTIIAMQPQYSNLPFMLQIIPPNSNRFDKETLLALNKLQKVANLNHRIKLCRTALTAFQYQELFLGAICLLVYEQQEYADKFSGVTLDAFYAGCPVVTIANTWMGEITLRFNAGIVLQQPTIETIKDAIIKIIDQYNFYHANAKQAAKYLIETHDPKHSLQAVYDYL